MIVVKIVNKLILLLNFSFVIKLNLGNEESDGGDLVEGGVIECDEWQKGWIVVLFVLV